MEGESGHELLVALLFRLIRGRGRLAAASDFFVEGREVLCAVEAMCIHSCSSLPRSVRPSSDLRRASTAPNT